MAGDMEQAQQSYGVVLESEPNNRDALLGLAAIALHVKQPEQAARYYTMLLELDPADADALAGLLSLRPGDPILNESQLKQAVLRHPQSGAAWFVLGNQYAQQARWPEAQQAYFRAYSSTPTNADYAFNLAVSLDALNHLKQAVDYYRRAVALAARSPANFDTDVANKRLQELAP